ncbi:hypothetical protein [Tellurirhabdus bombi]|uniref:hypothetical protein n=1 Tax=Tellurirhabdus bombi TaxID=2907205 RepID=UPI001F19CA96|nr:hypothetical protein [Tellurirhabdus bombi]
MNTFHVQIQSVAEAELVDLYLKTHRTHLRPAHGGESIAECFIQYIDKGLKYVTITDEIVNVDFEKTVSEEVIDLQAFLKRPYIQKSFVVFGFGPASYDTYALGVTPIRSFGTIGKAEEWVNEELPKGIEQPGFHTFNRVVIIPQFECITPGASATVDLEKV